MTVAHPVHRAKAEERNLRDHMMQINVSSEGFALTPHLRGVVVSRVSAAIGRFGAHVESVRVRLQVGTDRTSAVTSCDVSVSLRPTGDVHARADDVTLDPAIARAVAHIRSAVKREVSRITARPDGRQAFGVEAGAHGMRPTTVDRSQQQRRWFERSEDNRRSPRVREYWRPPGFEDDQPPDELERRVSLPW